MRRDHRLDISQIGSVKLVVRQYEFWILSDMEKSTYVAGGQGYKRLEIWQIASRLSTAIHRMSLQLPKFELYEEGSQIRRSSKSIRSNIVEGYGRRRYKQDFVRFLVCASASCDETIDHLESLLDTGSLSGSEAIDRMQKDLLILSTKLIVFIRRVDEQHLTIKEERESYGESI